MPIFKRLTYSLCILIATTMIVVLALSVGEGVGLVRHFTPQSLMFHPLYILVVYAIGFALAPRLHESMPISGSIPREEAGLKQPVGYGVRVAVLAAIGLLLALFANLIVYLLGEFT